MALKYHSDKNQGNEEANKEFAGINNAYEVLSDSEKRSIYDRYGEDRLKQHAARGGGGMNMQDIFSQYFGGGSMEEEEEKVINGDDVTVDLEATLQDLNMGGTLKDPYGRRNILGVCLRDRLFFLKLIHSSIQFLQKGEINMIREFKNALFLDTKSLVLTNATRTAGPLCPYEAEQAAGNQLVSVTCSSSGNILISLAQCTRKTNIEEIQSPGCFTAHTYISAPFGPG